MIVLQMVMITHAMAASLPSGLYVMDSGAEEHGFREINLFTNVQTSTSMSLQTADGIPVPAHVSSTESIMLLEVNSSRSQASF